MTYIYSVLENGRYKDIGCFDKWMVNIVKLTLVRFFSEILTKIFSSSTNKNID